MKTARIHILDTGGNPVRMSAYLSNWHKYTHMAISKSKKVKAQETADLFSLVSGTTRVLILMSLMKKKEMAVQDIAEELGMTHSAVSHQLGLLSGADIVSATKDGRLMHYRISGGKEAKALVKFLSALA